MVKFLFLVKIHEIYTQKKSALKSVASATFVLSFASLEMATRLSHAVITFLVRKELNEY